MAHASRFKLHDVLGSECCHPSCFSPPAPTIASPVPLCELHIYQVYKAVNRLLTLEQANTERYALVPVEAAQIAGPCPACGKAGYLSSSSVNEITCGNAACHYAATATDFERLRRQVLFELAADRDVVYYAQFRDLIKIGTSRSLRQRCYDLGIESLLGFEFGDRKQEAKRHRQFQQFHSHREWFDNTPQIRAHINEVCVTAA